MQDKNLTNDMKITQLTNRCVDLQNLIIAVQNELSKVLKQDLEQCKCENTNFLKKLNEKLFEMNFENNVLNKKFRDVATETDFDELTLEEQIKKYIKENEDLVTKCSELENCIELLRTEYERCEDYWSSKLDDERQMFEQEQSLSSEKLTELIGKMADYEAQFANQDEIDYRLPPIEEKYNLEKQFTDLEQEYEEYKEHTEFQLAENVNEIADLKEKLDQVTQKNTSDVGIQASSSMDDSGNQSNLENKMSNLSNCVVESTNLFSADTMPFGWSTTRNLPEQNSLENSLPNDTSIQRDYVNPSFVWNKSLQPKAPSPHNSEPNTNSTIQELPMNISWQNSQNISNSPQPFSIISLPSTSAESASTMTDNNATTPTRPKRSRRHEKNYKVQRLNKKDNKDKELNVQNHSQSLPFKWRTNNGEQMVTIPVGVLHNLNGRLHHLEQRYGHLQIVLKQQHYQAEQILQRK